VILAARVKAGWISEADLVADEDGDAEAETTEMEAEAGDQPAADDATAS
jgi:hypothetical protein